MISIEIHGARARNAVRIEASAILNSKGPLWLTMYDQITGELLAEVTIHTQNFVLAELLAERINQAHQELLVEASDNE
jgi:hypothetical protein